MEPGSMGWGRHLTNIWAVISPSPPAPAVQAKVATPTEGLKQAGCSRDSCGAPIRSGLDAMTDVGQKTKYSPRVEVSALPPKADIDGVLARRSASKLHAVFPRPTVWRTSNPSNWG